MTFSYFVELLMWFVPFELLTGIMIGGYFYNSLEAPFKKLTFYLVICFITDISSRIVGEWQGSNLFLYIIFSLFELLFFFFFFQKYFFGKRKRKWRIFVLISTIYMLIELYLFIHINPGEFQTYSKSLSSFVILVMVFDFLFVKLKEKELTPSLLRYCSVFITYWSLSLILFLPFNFLINVQSSVKFYFWLFNLFLTLFFYGFIIQEIWKNGAKPKQS